MLAARAVLKRAAVVVAARAPTTKVAAVPVRLFSEAKDAFFVDPKEVEERVISVLRNVEKITDKSKITSTSHFTKDLGLDSLDGVEVVLALEDEFQIEISDNDSERIVSVPVAVQFISTNPNAK